MTRSSASPSSRQSASSSSRICACTITSSAVVGSSAISTFGLQASAIAIAARWRIPPDSSCGKRSARAAGIPTDSSSSPVRARAAEPLRDAVQLERLDDLAADRLHRVERVHRALEHDRDVHPAMRADRRLAAGEHVHAVEQDACRRRWPSAGRSPMIASAVVVLPQPDSPTSPSRSPRSSVNRRPAPRAARRRPARSNQTCRSSTCSSGALTARRRRPTSGRSRNVRADRCATREPRVQRVLERAADEAAGEDDQRRRGARAARSPTTRPTRSPRARTRSRSPCPSEVRLGSPRPRNESAVSSKIATATVSTVFAISSGATCGSTWRRHDPHVAGAERPRPLHVDALAHALHLGADHPRGARPEQDPDHDHDVEQARPQMAATTIISGTSGMTRK